MRKSCTKSHLHNLMVALASAAALILFSASTLMAQFGNEVNPGPKRPEGRLPDQEFELRNLGKGVRKDLEVMPQRVTLGQLREDFKQIQVSNNDILVMLSKGQPLDYQLIAGTLNNIKKRANRIKTSQLLPPPESEIQGRVDASLDYKSNLRPALLRLDRLIISFVENPIFKTLNKVVDVKDAEKARQNLEDIIALCDRLRKSAGK
jgi:hypothetical protein